jgi:hypothetical protein
MAHRHPKESIASYGKIPIIERTLFNSNGDIASYREHLTKRRE